MSSLEPMNRDVRAALEAARVSDDCGGVTTLRLSGKYSDKYAQVSSCDRARLAVHTWSLLSGYAYNFVCGYMHQVVIGPRPASVPDDWIVDHADGDGMNNTRGNLRWTSMSFNAFNAAPRRNESSKFNGVNWCGRLKKWRAYFKGKHQGWFATEREAAEAAAKAALREWPEWAPTCRTLVGPDRFTPADIARLQEEISVEGVPVKKRTLPKGVYASKLRFAAWYKGSPQKYLGLFKTVDEARERVLGYTDEIEAAAWAAHLETSITLDADGDAAIALTGKGAGMLTKVPGNLWHQLTFGHSWSVHKGYARGTWESKGTELHCVVYKLLHPEYVRTKDLSIDHWNMIRLDNRACNLRLATRLEQSQNRDMTRKG